MMDHSDFIWDEISGQFKTLFDCQCFKTILAGSMSSDNEQIQNKDNYRSTLDAASSKEIIPWGWSRQIVKRFSKSQQLLSYLPSDRFIDNVIKQSNRKNTIDFFRTLRKHEGISENLPNSPKIIHEESELHAILNKSNKYILKSPLSGSGKGLCWCNKISKNSVSRWFNTTISKTGFVICEEIFEKEIDFAMEFYINNKEAKFCGYSLFKVDDNGVYRSNQLLSDKDIQNIIEGYIGAGELELYKSAILDTVYEMFSSEYTGYIGIDMIIYKDKCSDKYRINPCIEINMRMTMGLIARKFYDKYIKTGRGVFSIVYSDKPMEIYLKDKEMKDKYPLVIKNDSINSGYISLNKITNTTKYGAFVIID